MPNASALFENQPIRRIYDEATETWWFSVVDIVKILIQQPDTRKAANYWKVLKNRLAKEGSQLVTNCNQLKMTAEDGRQRLTDCAQPETILRLVQSVPSPKAEPIKLWLAKVGNERLAEIADPSLGIDRVRSLYQKQGRSEKWIERRLSGQETRNKLTDYWTGHEVKPDEEFAILTNLIHEEWSGVSVKEHKKIKGLERQNLRDHMTEAELIFTALAEMSTRQVAEADNATGLEENASAAHVGGGIAKRARKELESKTGQRVVSGESFLPPAKTIKGLKSE
jgi:DNA-damage-inducible protein D